MNVVVVVVVVFVIVVVRVRVVDVIAANDEVSPRTSDGPVAPSW